MVVKKTMTESEIRVEQFIVRIMREVNSFVKGQGNHSEAAIALANISQYLYGILAEEIEANRKEKEEET